MRSALLGIAAGGTGLVAGIFLAFSIAVMPALAAADARTFVATMNRINVAIVNPLFILMLLGTPVLLAIAAIMAGPQRGWVVVALVLNVVALVITMVVNVPLNNGLARADAGDAAGARTAFEHAWNLAHTVRTVLLVGSLGAAVVALATAAQV